MTRPRKDRRIHTCFVTKNREYHVRAGVVVAVRDRQTQVWIAGHPALGMRLRPIPPGAGYLGRKVEFYCTIRREVLQTSPVVDIIRPSRTTVDSYGFVHGFLPDEDTEMTEAG